MKTNFARLRDLRDCKHTSLFVFPIGFVAQCLMWPFLFYLGVPPNKTNETEKIILGIFEYIWFYIPLISIFGIYAGRFYIRKNGWSLSCFSPAAGVIINIAWLMLFFLIWLNPPSV